MDPREKIYENKADQIIKNLKKRNIKGIFCGSSRQAVDKVLKMIPDDSLVGLGGSETIIQTGLVEALRKQKIRLLDRYRDGISKQEVDHMRREGMLSDFYIASTNALTQDGRLVNIDGIGNRVAAMIYGPHKVILLAGMNKVVSSLEEAVSRIKNHVAPLNAVRVNVETPCFHLGYCNDPLCHAPHRICSQLVIIESNMVPDRITVILIGEDLGF